MLPSEGRHVRDRDWAEDRILPDCIRALSTGHPITVRNPGAIRPWQHVLEPLSGYLWLAAQMSQEYGARFADAWNFGPTGAGNVKVRDIVANVLDEWGSGSWADLSAETDAAPYEANFFKLDCTKANNLLGWEPVLTVAEMSV